MYVFLSHPPFDGSCLSVTVFFRVHLVALQEEASFAIHARFRLASDLAATAAELRIVRETLELARQDGVRMASIHQQEKDRLIEVHQLEMRHQDEMHRQEMTSVQRQRSDARERLVPYCLAALH